MRDDVRFKIDFGKKITLSAPLFTQCTIFPHFRASFCSIILLGFHLQTLGKIHCVIGCYYQKLGFF